ncbi:MAG: hypothetical protein ACT4OO_10920 [Nitrospiraceae bacterium]
MINAAAKPPVTPTFLGRWLLIAAMAGAAVLVVSHSVQGEDCHLGAEHDGLSFSVQRVTPEWRCRLAGVIDEYTTVGVVGPVRTPLSASLYSYLIDRPVLTGLLLRRLAIGPFDAAARGPNQFWVNDGDGTQGLLTVVQHDRMARIYHVDGYHEGQVFPLVKAKAVVFMAMKAVHSPGGQEAVETTLVSYVQLESRMLSAVVALLRPVVSGMITRKLTRGFEATHQLSQLIAQDPEKVVREASSPPAGEAEELESFETILKTMSHSSSAGIPARDRP